MSGVKAGNAYRGILGQHVVVVSTRSNPRIKDGTLVDYKNIDGNVVIAYPLPAFELMFEFVYSEVCPDGNIKISPKNKERCLTEARSPPSASALG